MMNAFKKPLSLVQQGGKYPNVILANEVFSCASSRLSYAH